MGRERLLSLTKVRLRSINEPSIYVITTAALSACRSPRRRPEIPRGPTFQTEIQRQRSLSARAEAARGRVFRAYRTPAPRLPADVLQDRHDSRVVYLRVCPVAVRCHQLVDDIATCNHPWSLNRGRRIQYPA